MIAPVRKPNRQRTARGFSVVELLLVVTLMGILAAFAMPKMRIESSQVDTAARTIGMSIMVAQREAASRQHDVLLVFDVASHTIKTVWDANNDGLIGYGEKTRPFLLPERVVLGRPGGVAALGSATASVPTTLMSGGKPMLVLSRNGSVDRSVTFYLSTQKSMAGSNEKEVRALVIARATARPEWYSWNGSAWRHAR